MSSRGAQVDRPTVSVFNWEEPNAQPGIADNEPERRHCKRNANETGGAVRFPIIQAADAKMWPSNRKEAKKTQRSRHQIGPTANDGAPEATSVNPATQNRAVGRLVTNSNAPL